MAGSFIPMPLQPPHVICALLFDGRRSARRLNLLCSARVAVTRPHLFRWTSLVFGLGHLSLVLLMEDVAPSLRGSSCWATLITTSAYPLSFGGLRRGCRRCFSGPLSVSGPTARNLRLVIKGALQDQPRWPSDPTPYPPTAPADRLVFEIPQALQSTSIASGPPVSQGQEGPRETGKRAAFVGRSQTSHFTWRDEWGRNS